MAIINKILYPGDGTDIVTELSNGDVQIFHYNGRLKNNQDIQNFINSCEINWFINRLNEINNKEIMD